LAPLVSKCPAGECRLDGRQVLGEAETDEVERWRLKSGR
jgi:hypothetical protein